MSEFHFLRPLWLATIPVLFLIIYLLKKQQFSQSGWQQFIPEHLSKLLIDGQSGKNKRPFFSALFVGILTIIALSGPTWQKLPQPVFQLEQGSVLIMDMSYSMYSTDIAPNRLTRSRYKASDLLTSINEGEIGLIAYAGDAFNISPLTKDVNNIKLLLDSLSPDIMPVAGSNPLAALAMADEMLINAGHVNGHIYWLTDGIDSSDLQDITQWSRQHPHRLNVLGIGTKEGAPIKLPNGELLKDNTGAIVVPKLSINKLYGAAQAGRGVYQTISTNASDINALVDFAKNEESNTEGGKNGKSNNQGSDTDSDLVRGDKWHEVGPWLILLVLPFVLFAFRRGVLFGLALTISFLPSPQVSANVWDDLWKTDNQQAQEKFSKQNYQGAAQQFNKAQWQGSAHYKNGDYEEALASFKQSNTAEALYNQGNSYAQLQQLDKAIDAYNAALEKDPQLEQAKENKALIEKLKQQQEQQKSENGDSDSGEQNQDNQENQQQDDQQGDSQDNQNGEQQQNQDQSQDQSSSENDSQSDPENSSQADDNSDAKNNEDEDKNKSDSDEASDKESESEQEPQAADAEQGENEGNEEAKTAAQLAEEQKAKETEQKHQQLLNKVTNDPYLLLRNKMQLEYQKRRHEQSSIGEKKKW